MNKILSFAFLLLFLILAIEYNYKLISEKSIYYKIAKNSVLSESSYNTTHYDISEKESNYINNIIRVNSTIVETTYKKMTSSIISYGNYYRYKNELVWKIIPTTRSYDFIGIGFYQTVKIHNNITYFEQYYCYNNGLCYTSTTNNPQIFVSGAGTSFKLPDGDLTTLKQTFYFDVEKNTSKSILIQKAYSDYYHATSTSLLNDFKQYSVVQSGGIVLNPDISNYYDSISIADATWIGIW